MHSRADDHNLIIIIIKKSRVLYTGTLSTTATVRYIDIHDCIPPFVLSCVALHCTLPRENVFINGRTAHIIWMSSIFFPSLSLSLVYFICMCAVCCVCPKSSCRILMQLDSLPINIYIFCWWSLRMNLFTVHNILLMNGIRESKREHEYERLCMSVYVCMCVFLCLLRHFRLPSEGSDKCSHSHEMALPANYLSTESTYSCDYMETGAGMTWWICYIRPFPFWSGIGGAAVANRRRRPLPLPSMPSVSKQTHICRWLYARTRDSRSPADERRCTHFPPCDPRDDDRISLLLLFSSTSKSSISTIRMIFHSQAHTLTAKAIEIVVCPKIDACKRRCDCHGLYHIQWRNLHTFIYISKSLEAQHTCIYIAQVKLPYVSVVMYGLRRKINRNTKYYGHADIPSALCVAHICGCQATTYMACARARARLCSRSPAITHHKVNDRFPFDFQFFFVTSLSKSNAFFSRVYQLQGQMRRGIEPFFSRRQC